MGVKFRIWLFVLILKGQGSHCSILTKEQSDVHWENLIWEQKKCSIRRGSVRSGEVILDENRLGS